MNQKRLNKKRKAQLIAILHVLNSGSLFNQLDPATGTLYTASADGTFIWSLEQPASPDDLDQLRGGFRVQDISSNGIGTVTNGWEWRLEYQTNGTWTFSWYSVTNGTASAAIQTQTNIGTVTNVRVILDGNSLSVATSADGENYTARGSTTSTTYQTETGISASYTGASGTELTANNEFVNWTGGEPDNWTVSLGSTGVITEVVDGIRIQVNGETSRPLLTQAIITGGLTYRFLITSTAFSGANQIVWRENFATVAASVTSPGTFATRGTVNASTTTAQLLSLGATVDGTISFVSLQLINALDASGDGGFSEVAQS